MDIKFLNENKRRMAELLVEKWGKKVTPSDKDKEFIDYYWCALLKGTNFDKLTLESEVTANTLIRNYENIDNDFMLQAEYLPECTLIFKVFKYDHSSEDFLEDDIIIKDVTLVSSFDLNRIFGIIKDIANSDNILSTNSYESGIFKVETNVNHINNI